MDPDTSRDCGVNEADEVWARGPQIVMGYLENPEVTAETFVKDGFLHTGDIGRFDDKGLLAITDRMKEMIKVKGMGFALLSSSTFRSDIPPRATWQSAIGFPCWRKAEGFRCAKAFLGVGSG